MTRTPNIVNWPEHGHPAEPKPGCEYYTAADVARLFGVHRSTIGRWCKSKRIPFVQLGAVIRFPRREFDIWRKQSIRRSAPAGQVRSQQT